MIGSAFPVSRRGLLAATGGAAALAMAGCGRRASRDPSTLVIGQEPEPLSLCAAASMDGGTLALSPKIFDRLFNFDLRGELIPMLAESSDVDPDGKRVTIRLRPGLFWHDGRPITSADVAFSIDKAWRFNARSRLAFVELDGVDTPDARTTVLRYKQPTPFLFSALADGVTQLLPRHIYEGKGDVRFNPANQKPVGSGPWIFEQWEKGDYISLRRNPHYWNPGEPHLERLIFRMIGAGASAAAALEAGDVDYASIPVTDAARLKGDPGLWTRPLGPEVTTTFTGFAFNLNKPALRDPRVRHAFAHAIDRDFVLRNIYLGYGALADGPVAPGSYWHADGLPKYPYDPAKAEQLLDAAGLPRGKDGVRLRLYNDIMPASTVHPQLAQYIRQCLLKVGIDLQLRQEALPNYLDRIFTTRDWDTETYGTGSDIDPAIGIQRFYESSAITIGVPFSNPTHYATPETDRLFAAAATDPDQARRKQLYDRIQHIVQTDLPLIPILFPSTVEAGTRRYDIPLTARARNLADARFIAG